MAENRNPLSETLVGLSSVVFILIGAYFALPSAKILYDVHDSRNWPQISGHVLSSKVERRWASRGDDLSQEYLSRVWFSYSVGGRDYVSGTLFLAQPWGKDLGAVREQALEYPSGKAVDVYYNPADPGMAVLSFGVVPSAECVRFGIGLLFIMSGAVALISSFAKAPSNDRL
ncbi:MAG: DUF3592 domain-containing protein [Candidatus Omnitrophota bacterium]